MAVYTQSTLPAGRLQRFTSGIRHIDWLLGSEHDEYGFARGGLSLWGGQAGVGKTRALVSICEALTAIRLGPLRFRVLWFQNEQPLSLFKGKYLAGKRLGDNFMFSDASDVSRMCEIISETEPDLVVVDSINKVDQYRNSEGVLKSLEKMFRKTITNLPFHAHMALITQLNAEGDIKGGTTLPHMVDTVLHIEWNLKPLFTISIPDKNRFGLSGEDMWVGCGHRKYGISFETTGKEFDLGLGLGANDEVITAEVVERPLWHYFMLIPAVLMTILGFFFAILLAVIGCGDAAKDIANFDMWWGIFCGDTNSLKRGFGVLPHED